MAKEAKNWLNVMKRHKMNTGMSEDEYQIWREKMEGKSWLERMQTEKIFREDLTDEEYKVWRSEMIDLLVENIETEWGSEEFRRRLEDELIDEFDLEANGFESDTWNSEGYFGEGLTLPWLPITSLHKNLFGYFPQLKLFAFRGLKDQLEKDLILKSEHFEYLNSLKWCIIEKVKVENRIFKSITSEVFQLEIYPDGGEKFNNELFRSKNLKKTKKLMLRGGPYEISKGEIFYLEELDTFWINKCFENLEIFDGWNGRELGIKILPSETLEINEVEMKSLEIIRIEILEKIQSPENGWDFLLSFPKLKSANIKGIKNSCSVMDRLNKIANRLGRQNISFNID